MISTRTLACATLVAISAFSGRPAAAAGAARSTTVREGGAVTALSVVPNERTTDVVIRVSGSITFNHFTLTKPDKIVVDVNGATLGLPTTDAYDGVARGAIKGVRYSQFTKSVVRIVVTLDGPHPYGVLQHNGELRINIDGGAKFDAWTLGGNDASRDATRDVLATDPVADAIVSQAKMREPTPVSATRTPPRAPRAQQSQEPRITINWEKADINEVLGIFASYTNRTILPSRAVQGTISANIVNLPWDVALKEVMNANGYDVTVNGDGVIVIDTFENIAARQSTIPLQTRTVRLNYARAAAVQPMVQVRLTHSCPVTAQQQANQPPAISPAGAMPQPGGAMTTPAQPNGGATPNGQSQQPGSTINTVSSLQCSQRGAVIADTITNSVAITDVPSALDDLEHYARSLDVRQPQVNIKAKIILVDRTTLEGLGLRYDIGTQQQFFNDIVPRLDSAGNPVAGAGQILLGGNTVSAIANASARVPAAALQLVFSTAMGNYDFTTFLEALQTNTLLDVQAEPSATVLNNRVANLTAGTEVPIRVIDAGASSAGTNSSLPRATVQFRQTGVILQVIPQITNNRQVQMKVHVENSSVQFQTSDVGAVFPKQSVDNEMLVADGETMVVGGLTQTEVNLTKTGLPVLVDLPIIGRLFGVTNRTETKRDLLILITPHIIDEGTTPDSGRP